MTPKDINIPERSAKISFSLSESSSLFKSRLKAPKRLRRLAMDAITPSFTRSVTRTSWSWERVFSILSRNLA